MTVQIVEIIERSIQGATKPFICRGDDKQIYFVKGRGAGRRSQICEWVAGLLGREMGLPIAEFEIVDIPEELLEERAEHLNELGAGPAFGSRKCLAAEFTYSTVGKVPPDLQRDILAFDWWICNGDRALTEVGGNSNLLWDSFEERLIVIDHNLAFDQKLSKKDFLESHVFNSQAQYISKDLGLQNSYSAKFTKVLLCLEAILDTIPQEWWFSDPEATVATDFNIQEVRDLLMQCHNNGFWTFP